MKNDNKGFTLIELIIAVSILCVLMTEVGMLMFNSSKLYQSATEENNIQNEAQRVTTIIEELLVDADVQVSTNDLGTASPYDELIVKKTEVPSPGAVPVENTYKLYLRDYANGHGDLWVDVNGSSELVASNLAMFKVNMADYQSANKVNLNFKFSDGRLEYGDNHSSGASGTQTSFSKDFYIRNELANGGSVPTPDVSDNDIDKYLMRYEEVDLAKLTAHKKAIFNLSDADNFTFEVEDADTPAVPGYLHYDSNHNFVYNSVSGTMYLTDNVNNDYDFETKKDDPNCKPCVVDVTFNGADCFKITFAVEPVEIGLSASSDTIDTNNWSSMYLADDLPSKRRTGEIVAYANNQLGATSNISSLAEAKGIDLSKAKNGFGTSFSSTDPLHFDLFYENYDFTGRVNNSTATVVERDPSGHFQFSGSPFPSGVRFQDGVIFRKDDINAIAFQFGLFHSDGASNDASAATFYQTMRPVILCHMYFDSDLLSATTSESTLTLRVYPAPSGEVHNGASVIAGDSFYNALKAGVY